MSDALEEHDGKVSIGGRNITSLRSVDDIDALAEEEQELEALVESLDKTCTRYKMEISAEKTKLFLHSIKLNKYYCKEMVYTSHELSTKSFSCKILSECI